MVLFLDHVTRGGCNPLWTGILTRAQLTLSRHYRVGIWHGGVLGVTSPSAYVTAFGVAGALGLEEGVGCNPRVTFEGRCEIWGYKPFVCVL